MVHFPIQLCENSYNFIVQNHWINFSPINHVFIWIQLCVWMVFIYRIFGKCFSFYLFCVFCNTNPHPFWCKVLQISIDNRKWAKRGENNKILFPQKSALEEIVNYDFFIFYHSCHTNDESGIVVYNLLKINHLDFTILEPI